MIRRALFVLSRRLYRWFDGLILGRLSPERAARARVAIIWLGHLAFPNKIGEPNPALLAGIRRLSPKVQPLPAWAISEMKVQAEFDPLLFPSAHSLPDYECWPIPYEYEAPGRAYARLYAAAAGSPVDHLMFVPWLKIGGADHAALLHAQVMSESFGKRVLVVATDRGDSPWAARLAPGVRFVAAGEELAPLDEAARAQVLARLVLQLAPESLHIIHSMPAWKTIRLHGLALRQSTRIYASAFCDDITEEGERVSAARLNARESAPHLTAVFTDCVSYAARLAEDTGMASDKIRVLYLPASISPVQWRPSLATTPPRVLWAGRLDRQKRPDILAAIAAANRGVHFDVFGTPVLNADTAALDTLRALSNVTLHGAYAGFDSLPWRDASVLLYTSEWDGLPNVLLEAAARGMPIVAPAVGGIPELLGATHPLLVAPWDSVQGFNHALRRAIEMRGEPARLATEAVQQRLRHVHSEVAFEAALREAFEPARAAPSAPTPRIRLASNNP
jgi:glycosyltransferase involved in cell wall biosynthesis